MRREGGRACNSRRADYSNRTKATSAFWYAHVYHKNVCVCARALTDEAAEHLLRVIAVTILFGLSPLFSCK